MIQDMAMEQKRKNEQAKGKAANYIRWCLKFAIKIKYILMYQEIEKT